MTEDEQMMILNLRTALVGMMDLCEAYEMTDNPKYRYAQEVLETAKVKPDG